MTTHHCSGRPTGGANPFDFNTVGIECEFEHGRRIVVVDEDEPAGAEALNGLTFSSDPAPTRLLSSSSPRQPISTAKRGLITSSMIASRSSNGMNADFIALMVNRARSVQP